jgi:hypothetical protein
MRFMVMHKQDKDSEAGVPPSQELMAGMGTFTAEGVKAGVLLSAEGLEPSSKGVRLKFSGGKRSVIDGPFTESKELVGGFAMVQVKSKEETIEWASQFAKVLCDAKVVGDVEIDVRQVLEVSEFR